MELKDWLGENNQIGYDIWTKKYQRNNETLDEWFKRVSGGNKEVEKLIREKKFLFGGRVLANRGIKGAGNYYNCFSGGYVPDDYSGILDKCKEIGITFKNQGGQGLSLTKIRPKGTQIGELYESDGILGFMKLFNCVTEETSQGGARKGALMLSIDIRHKEAEDFITIKTNEDKITKANLSLEIDDDFMKAVQKYYETGEIITLHEKRNYSAHIVEYDICPIKLYKKMMETVYDWAEPGCIFTNQARNYNLLEFDNEYEIATTNPCGEQPLKSQTCCNLGSLNLYEFVKNKFTSEAYFDMEEFGNAIVIASNALDDIIDENSERLPEELTEYRKNAESWRNIGLGIFNYAHALIALGLTYGSLEALDFTNKLFKFMAQVALYSNMDRGDDKGSYPKFKLEAIKKSNYYNNINDFSFNTSKDFKLRNCTMLSIAPTGSIATMLEGSGGIEPEFQFEYIRKTDNLNESYKIESKIVKDFRKIHPNEPLPEYFVSSKDIDWLYRIDTQAIIQKYIDTAISSTVNLPNSISLEEIEQLYLYAWKKDLKGITIYRDGCKRGGILISKEDKEINEANEPKRGEVIKIDDQDAIGFKRKLMTGCGSLHCTAYFDVNSGDLVETYLSKGSTGGCNNFMIGLSRMISMAARGGIPIQDIVDQLMSTGACPSYAVRTATKHDTSKGSCCPMAVGYALKEMWEEFQGKEMKSKEPKKEFEVETIYATAKDGTKLMAFNYTKCPECGESLTFEGGCNICKSCGWSKCD